MIRPTGLLVSVRSVVEATSAVNGGASIVDVKEPDRGPLGMADFAVWMGVRDVVPPTIPVSVALGELTDWTDRPTPDLAVFAEIQFRKIGLARSGRFWKRDWTRLRDRLGDGPAWIAVIYRDWIAAEAPDPDAVIDAARELGCAGVLIDTWDKSVPNRLDDSWFSTVRRIKTEVGIVALAGRMDAGLMTELRVWEPDFFAVRGAACEGGDRHSVVSQRRVAALVNLLTAPTLVAR